MTLELFSSLLEEFISKNDTVVVPGLGVFKATVQSASISDKGFTINPPFRKLDFSPEQDALSVQSPSFITLYAEAAKISHEDIQRELAEIIELINSILEKEAVLELPGLGKLRTLENGKVFFIMDREADIFPEGFGLESVSLKNKAFKPEGWELASVREPQRKEEESTEVKKSSEAHEEPAAQVIESSEAKEEPAAQVIESSETQEEPAAQVVESGETQEEPAAQVVESSETKEDPAAQVIESSEAKEEGSEHQKVNTEEEEQEEKQEKEESGEKKRQEKKEATEKEEKKIKKEQKKKERRERKKSGKWFWRLLWALTIIAIVLLCAFLLLSRFYPELLDKILYSPEELELIKSLGI